MKITILGASGAIGALLVSRAAAAGHEVVAVSRGPLAAVPSGVRVERGSLSDVAFLTRTMQGSDVVLSALGLRLPGLAPWHRPEVPDFLDTSTAAIVQAMRQANVRRVLAVSSSGIGDSAPLLPGAFKVFIAVTAMRHAWPALNRMEASYFASGLDVTMVRPTGLSDGPATGTIVEPTKLVGRAEISRADVADWMLAEAARAEVRRAVVITTTGAA